MQNVLNAFESNAFESGIFAKVKQGKRLTIILDCSAKVSDHSNWQDLNLYRGVAGKEGVTFFRGWVADLYEKKTKIWNILTTKKVYKYFCFSHN